MSKKQKTDAAAPTETTPKAPKAFQLPYKVTCSQCGAVKAVRHEVLLKRLEGVPGANDEERFNNHILTYKCAACRKVEREAAKAAAAEAKAAAKAEASA